MKYQNAINRLKLSRQSIAVIRLLVNYRFFIIKALSNTFVRNKSKPRRHAELVSASPTIIKKVRKSSFVYILTNSTNKVLYIGVTTDLERRLHEHKNKLTEGFSKKYKLHKLIYFEEYNNVKDAIAREKQLKNWHRDWKLNLIKAQNPNFKNLDPETSSG